MAFSRTAREALGHYVYALVDPRDGTIFYVGKANANNRAFDHLHAASSEHAMSKRIFEIREDGMEPQIDILRYGLSTEDVCFEVEAAIIDALGLENLTNAVRGHGVDRGRQTAEGVERLHGSKPVNVEDLTESLMLFFISRTYSPTLSEQQLYDATRQFWYGVAARTRVPDPDLPYRTALAVVDSVIVRAYTVEAWLPGGATLSSRATATLTSDRWEFVGQVQPRHPLLGKRLLRNGTNLQASQQGYGYIN